MYRYAGILIISGLFLLGCRKPGADANTDRFAPDAELSMEDISSWRQEYQRYLGKDKEVVVERFGKPADSTDGFELVYRSSGSSRDLAFATTKGKIFMVVVYPGANEDLDIESVVSRASGLSFSHGVFSGSAEEYFAAETKDRKTLLQFKIKGDRVKFYRAMFN